MANASMPPAQSAIAYINAQIASMAAAEGRPLTDLPTRITKEYLQANPYYFQMFRRQMAVIAAQQRQPQQQQQQQQQPVRPGMPPNMAMVAQMMQIAQGGASAAANPG
ncbi:hypothetical protein IWW51_005793, partial [Coemansia sp. RSA 2702]